LCSSSWLDGCGIGDAQQKHSLAYNSLALSSVNVIDFPGLGGRARLPGFGGNLAEGCD
jgi:hypothetical protein